MKHNQARWIRSAVDFGALAAFLTAYVVTHDVIKATWALVAASAVALVVGFVVERRLAPMPLIAGVFALIFGVLTIVLHDKNIIKIKITAMNGMFAAILLGSLFVGKNPIKSLLGESVALPEQAWRTLTVRYGLFFLACAALNEFVWRTQSDDFWMLRFRPALWIAAILFAFAQVPFMLKHMQKEPAEEPITPEPPDPGF
jgi:intracellular septation protein